VKVSLFNPGFLGGNTVASVKRSSVQAVATNGKTVKTIVFARCPRLRIAAGSADESSGQGSSIPNGTPTNRVAAPFGKKR
jgi:hypothetical protein